MTLLTLEKTSLHPPPPTQMLKLTGNAMTPGCVIECYLVERMMIMISKMLLMGSGGGREEAATVTLWMGLQSNPPPVLRFDWFAIAANLQKWWNTMVRHVRGRTDMESLGRG